MPEFPYGLGFVKSYADYLGLDGEALYEAYKKEINYISKNDPSRMDFEVIGTTSYSPNYTYVIVSLIAVVVIYMLWFAYSTYMTPSSSSSSRDTYKSPVKEQILEDIKFDNKEIIMDAQEADNGYEEFDAITGFEDVTKEEAKAEEEVQIAEVEKLKPQISGRGVEIAVKDVTWFEVKNENRLFVSKEFKAGDVYKVPNLRGLLISAGRVENIEVYIDGNLTKVFTPYRKTNISLDEVLENTNH